MRLTYTMEANEKMITPIAIAEALIETVREHDAGVDFISELSDHLMVYVTYNRHKAKDTVCCKGE